MANNDDVFLLIQKEVAAAVNDKKNIRLYLSFLESFLKDVMNYRTHRKIVFVEQKEDIIKFSKKFENITYMIDKVVNLRIFDDENGVMNKSLLDVGGSILSISQFTLYADSMSSGNRPSFINAARPEKASEIYEYIVKECKKQIHNIQIELYHQEYYSILRCLI